MIFVQPGIRYVFHVGGPMVGVPVQFCWRCGLPIISYVGTDLHKANMVFLKPHTEMLMDMKDGTWMPVNKLHPGRDRSDEMFCRPAS